MLSVFAAPFGVLLGVAIAFQTAINVRLRQTVISPLLASFVSFLIGTIALAVIVSVQGGELWVGTELIRQSPWWIWSGGALAMFGLTVNVLIFPRLGSVQTAVMPILGQIMTGMLIDTFGWFASPQYSFTLLRFFGVLSVLTGIATAIILPSFKQKQGMKAGQKSLRIWQCLGILGGVAVGITPAVNAALGKTLGSALQSSFIPFLTAALLLALVISVKEPVVWKNLKTAIKQPRPRWQWFGGILGAAYVGGIILLVPLIGTGGAIITSLFGLLTGSLFIDQFGLLGATKKPVGIMQLIGLVILLDGVVMIQLSK